jgi:hypothetical protein
MTFENNINIENVDIKFSMRGHHGHVLMVVALTTTCVISAYHH